MAQGETKAILKILAQQQCPRPLPGEGAPRRAPISRAQWKPGRTQPGRAAVAVAQTGQPETARLWGAAVHADGALPAPAPDARALHAPHGTAHQRSLRGPPSAATVAAAARTGPGFRSGT